MTWIKLGLGAALALLPAYGIGKWAASLECQERINAAIYDFERMLAAEERDRIDRADRARRDSLRDDTDSYRRD